MRLHIWGSDYKRQASEERSKLYLPEEKRKEILEDLLSVGLTDIVYLWTCNRVEFYTMAKDPFIDMRPVFMKVCERLGFSKESYYRGYHYEGKAAFRHLLRVASSLESQVIGEPQILGQLKEAYEYSKKHSLSLEKSLERSFQFVFETAKRVRTETAIGEKSVSVASLGFEFLMKHEEEIPLEKAVVIGRGPISLLAIEWIQKNRPHCPIIWVNRRVDLLSELREKQIYPERIETVSLDSFIENPHFFSHLFTSTGSVIPVLKEAFFDKLGHEKTRLFFDFAEPPDIEWTGLACFKIVRLENLFEESARNAESRKAEVHKAEQLIESSLKNYCLDQKETPFLKDFNQIEPQFLDELNSVFSIIEKELPESFHVSMKKSIEKLVKKNLHLSREHLKAILRKASQTENVEEV